MLDVVFLIDFYESSLCKFQRKEEAVSVPLITLVNEPDERPALALFPFRWGTYQTLVTRGPRSPSREPRRKA